IGPLLPGGMSFTVNRVPFGGGGVPRTRAPMSSAFSPTEISAGVRSVHQIRVETPPDFEIRLFVAGPSIRIFATCFASCPVTTRRIGGYSSLWSVIARAPGSADPLLRLFHPRQGRGSLAHDDQPGFLVLGAVPVHLLGEVRDERAGRHGDGEVGIELVAGGDPPGAFDHGDEAVIGMEVRPAEIARLEPVH